MRPSIEDDAASICFLIEMGHPQGTVYAATCLEGVEWSGKNYLGVGLVAEVAGLDESAKVEVREVTLSLSGVPEDLRQGLSTSIKGYEATIRHALLDDFNRVVGEPEIVDVVALDTQDFLQSTDGTTTITITGYSVIVDLRNTPDTYYTPEFQRERFPDDTGLDRIPALVDRVASWTET
ncbi:MAG: hypothetical protein KI785_15775 [Devosiaceae bacterium]|nr:hypothetical protein [Devosiaceae bacterium MH13]